MKSLEKELHHKEIAAEMHTLLILQTLYLQRSIFITILLRMIQYDTLCI